jgi:exodeoxyribonuclease VII large subunit
MKVILHGYITLYEKRGEYQLIATSVFPKGKGEFYQRFEALKKKFRDEGLFAEKHKKPIPFLPRKIGIITSPRGAALFDILKIINRRFPKVHIIIYPVQVQGENAPTEIKEALSYFNQKKNVEVIILARGGGSIEDLWAFNEEVVVREIFSSEIPVISAIGHEVDYTLSDFVADKRAETPTAAAKIVVPEKQELEERLLQSYLRIKNALRERLRKGEREVENIITRRAFRNPEEVLLTPTIQFIEELKLRLKSVLQETVPRAKHNLLFRLKMLESSLKEILQQKKIKLKNLEGKLTALNPMLVLERGYSITFKLPEKKIVKDAKLLSPNEELEIKFWKGEIKAKVTS